MTCRGARALQPAKQPVFDPIVPVRPGMVTGPVKTCVAPGGSLDYRGFPDDSCSGRLRFPPHGRAAGTGPVKKLPFLRPPAAAPLAFFP